MMIKKAFFFVNHKMAVHLNPAYVRGFQGLEALVNLIKLFA